MYNSDEVVENQKKSTGCNEKTKMHKYWCSSDAMSAVFWKEFVTDYRFKCPTELHFAYTIKSEIQTEHALVCVMFVFQRTKIP